MATNPFSPVSSVTRAKYWISEGKHEAITQLNTYLDGGIESLTLNPLVPVEWEILWTGLTEAEATAIDDFFEEKKYTNSFQLDLRDGRIATNVFFTDYERSHNKQFSQTRTMTLKYFPGTGTLTPIEAVAFWDAAGITDATQKQAVGDLIAELKSAEVWDKMLAVYPLVGGSADSHKYNLVNPVDTDAGFRLTYAGTITHNANGMTGNGSDGWARTYLVPSTESLDDDWHISCYSRTDSTEDTGCAIGAKAGGSSTRISILPRLVDGNADTQGASTATDSTAVATSQRFFCSSRTGSADYDFRYRETNTNITQASGTIPNFNFALLARGITSTTVEQFSARNYSFFSIGQGLTVTETLQLKTAVDNFQTTLGRNV